MMEGSHTAAHEVASILIVGWTGLRSVGQCTRFGELCRAFLFFLFVFFAPAAAAATSFAVIGVE
jgi:hypothetical protein